MPRFYFDIVNGHGPIPDDEGLELADLNAAQKEAVMSLVDMVKEMRPTTESHAIEVEVRDEKRTPVLKARLHFDVMRLKQ